MTLFFFLFRKFFSGRRFFICSTNLLNLCSISVCIAFFVIITSVFYGFQKQIRSSVFKFDPHITITNSISSNVIKEYPSLINQINQIVDPSSIELAQGMIQSPAILRHFEQVEHVFLRGQEFQLKGKQYTVPQKFFPKIISPANLQTFKKGNHCFVGTELALHYGLEIGDSIELIVPKGQFFLRLGLEPSIQTFKILGIFQSNNYEYDSQMVIIPLQEAQELFSLKDVVQSIILKLKSVKEIRTIQNTLSENLPVQYSISSLLDEQQIFFSALQLEKTMVSIIMFLFIILSLLLITFTTNTTIRNKQKEIGILKAMGVSNFTIFSIFMSNVIIIVLSGILIGLIFGILLALQLDYLIKLLEQVINYIGLLLASNTWQVVQLIPTHIYYFEKIPIHISTHTIFISTVITFCLACLMTLIPLRKISRIHPIYIIKHGELST